VAVYGESAPSYYKVKFWSKQFKWGRESIEDNPHTGCPVEVTSEEMCQKLESLILADRRMKVSRLAERQASQQEQFGPLFMKSWTCPRSVQDGSQECRVLFRRTLVASAVTRTWSCSLRIRNIFFNVSWQETRLGYITEILSPKWSSCSGSTRLPPPLKCIGLKNLLAVMATVFWDEKGLAFRIHATENYHNWTDLC